MLSFVHFQLLKKKKFQDFWWSHTNSVSSQHPSPRENLFYSHLWPFTPSLSKMWLAERKNDMWINSWHFITSPLAQNKSPSSVAFEWYCKRGRRTLPLILSHCCTSSNVYFLFDFCFWRCLHSCWIVPKEAMIFFLQH